jgi:hypothetical protein
MHSGTDFHPVGKGLRIFQLAIAGLVTAIFFGLLFGYFVALLWNWLMPAIFKLAKITYWQAFGIIMLARLIFGSFGHARRIDYLDHHKHWCYVHDHRGRMDWSDWKYYDEWWHSEGNSAFENYVREIEHKKEDNE